MPTQLCYNSILSIPPLIRIMTAKRLGHAGYWALWHSMASSLNLSNTACCKAAKHSGGFPTYRPQSRICPNVFNRASSLADPTHWYPCSWIKVANVLVPWGVKLLTPDMMHWEWWKRIIRMSLYCVSFTCAPKRVTGVILVHSPLPSKRGWNRPQHELHQYGRTGNAIHSRCCHVPSYKHDAHQAQVLCLIVPGVPPFFFNTKASTRWISLVFRPTATPQNTFGTNWGLCSD